MKLSKKQLAKIHAGKKWDEKPIDHLGLPKPDYEERYGKLPKAWNTMTDEQKRKYLR
tara:strand:+ start:45 stop:215 length:171 start_codon:yes stop_codon:yes gene_type:complete